MDYAIDELQNDVEGIAACEVLNRPDCGMPSGLSGLWPEGCTPGFWVLLREFRGLQKGYITAILGKPFRGTTLRVQRYNPGTLESNTFTHATPHEAAKPAKPTYSKLT